MANFRQGRQPLLDLPLPFMDVLLHLIQSKDDDIAKHSALCLSNLVMDPEGKSAETKTNSWKGARDRVHIRACKSQRAVLCPMTMLLNEICSKPGPLGSRALHVLSRCQQKQIEDFFHEKISHTPTKRTLTLVCTLQAVLYSRLPTLRYMCSPAVLSPLIPCEPKTFLPHRPPFQRQPHPCLCHACVTLQVSGFTLVQADICLALCFIRFLSVYV